MPLLLARVDSDDTEVAAIARNDDVEAEVRPEPQSAERSLADAKLAIGDVFAKTLPFILNFDGPAFVEVIIDPEAGVYPMVGPGLSYRDMITGDFIPNRNDAEEPKQPDASEMF